MSSKKCLTYVVDKSLDKAQYVVEKLCLKVLSLEDTTISNLQKMCGTIVYSSIFLIADYDLVEGKHYTLENVCYHVPGLLKIPLHDLLEQLSDICFDNTDIVGCLKNILSESLYPEVIDMLKLNTKDTYSALLCMYFRLTEDFVKLNKVIELWKSPNTHIITLYTYFEREVLNNEINLY